MRNLNLSRWHEFKGAKLRELKRNLYDKKRRVRYNRALGRATALIGAIRFGVLRRGVRKILSRCHATGELRLKGE